MTEVERAALEAVKSRIIAKDLNYMSGLDAGWAAARDFFTGQGYTPRSLLRLQAAQQGVCPICSEPQKPVE